MKIESHTKVSTKLCQNLCQFKNWPVAPYKIDYDWEPRDLAQDPKSCIKNLNRTKKVHGNLKELDVRR